jgi:hypothetical protein
MCVIGNHDDQTHGELPYFCMHKPKCHGLYIFPNFLILPIYLQVPMKFKGSYKFLYLGSKLNNEILVMMDIF